MDFEIAKLQTRQVYNMLIGMITPRPIALITSQDEHGQLNAAPFSAFNYFCVDPPIVGVGVTNRPEAVTVPKDTAHNIRRTHEFVVNVVTEDIARKMNICATDFPAEVNELEVAGFTTAPSMLVKAPRIREAHASLECREYTTMEIGNSRIILGEVVALHVEDEFVDPAGPYIKAEELHTIGRMNGLGNYVRTRDAFLNIPRIPYKKWLEGERGED